MVPQFQFLYTMLDIPVVAQLARIVILVALSYLFCRVGLSRRTTATVFRLPRGTWLVRGATTLIQLSSASSYLRAHPCGLDYELFLPCLCGEGFSGVLAAYGFILRFWWFCVTCCAELDFLSVSQASTRHTTCDESCTLVQLAPASSAFECTSLRTDYGQFLL